MHVGSAAALDAAPSLRSRRVVTAGVLLVGYTGYYLCRSNLSVAAPLLVTDPSSGLDREALGLVASAGVLAYAIGKVVMGTACDFIGGRTMFLAGMAGSALATVLFGAGAGATWLLLAWTLNRFVQSGGWGALVKITAHWFPAHSYGRVMAVLSLSYLFGDALVRVVLGQLLLSGVGWRGLFIGTAAVLTVLAGVTSVLLHERPDGRRDPPVNMHNVYGAHGGTSRADSLGSLLGPLVRSPAFWVVCVLSIALTLIREACNIWIPTYLVDVHSLSAGSAAQFSAAFPLAGGVSTLAAGAASDRWAARGRLIVAAPLLAVAALTLSILATSTLTGRVDLALLLFVVLALCLLGPYSLLAGAVALDLGGRRGSATTAGLIDAAGYLGAVVSGVVIGSLVQRAGWASAFWMLAASAAVSVAAVLVYARLVRATSDACASTPTEDVS